MSLATAGEEIPKLALKHGWELKSTHKTTLSFFHHERVEGFSLCLGDDGISFDHASWFAATEWVIVVDKRGPGERSARDGLSLAPTGKRRAVGMGEVRPELRTSIKGLEIGYMAIKRRIKDADWRNK